MNFILQVALGFSIAVTAAIAVGQDEFFDSDGVRIRYIQKGTGEPVE